MEHELREFASDEDLAQAGATYIGERAREAIEAKGWFSLALSGGHTPRKMLSHLATLPLAWESIVIYQVDERVVALDDEERNLTDLRASLAELHPRIEPMPVDDLDLDAAAHHYAQLLPTHLDLVHLGLGPDGHTASLVPGDDALTVSNALVTMTGLYNGHRRMTMTYEALARAHQILWLVAGEDKRDALARLRKGDHSIPAGRVQAAHSLIMTDLAAL
jgi:6-phosphogluconolactonase